MTDERTPTVLSSDFATANRALAESIKNRDVQQVGQALAHQSLEIRLQAAEALGEMGNRTAVPLLLDALERNQVYYTGGSETKILQTDLNRTLIATLQKLTGIDFGVASAPSEQDIDRVLQISRQWWEENK